MMVGGVGPVVMDFGLAKHVLQADQKLTQSGMVLGTPAYMPPEQVKGELEHMGPASDIYSLGVILYELLTGRLPFEGTAGAIYGQILYTEPPLPSAVVPGLDPALDGICRKAMAKTPTERYPSMKAFAAALLDFWRRAPAAGASSLEPAASDKAAIFLTPTVAPGPVPADKPAIFQIPTVVPEPRAAVTPPRPVKVTSVVTERSRPGGKRSGKRRRGAGAKGLVIGLSVGGGILVIALVVLIIVLTVGGRQSDHHPVQGAWKRDGGVGAPAAPPLPLAAPTFAGQWETTYGPLTLHQQGALVSGVYFFLGKRCTLQGKVVGTRLEFTYQEPSAKGEGWFDLAADGRTFQGTWRYIGSKTRGNWTGKRIERQ
jgi:hypothetical protein